MDTNQNICIEEEIDLVELWKTIIDKKKFIIIFTIIVTLLATVYAFTKTPIYEVKSNIKIGFIGKNQIAKADVLVKILKLVFNIEDGVETKQKFISKVSSINTNKKLKNFIEIKTEAISNDEAVKENKKVVKYIQNLYKPKIVQYILNMNNQTKDIKQKISNIDIFETKNIQREIELLRKQSVVKIDDKIKRLQKQTIKGLQRQINLLKTQNIVEINEKIDFYKNIKIPILTKKIEFHIDKLKKYTVAVNNIYTNSKDSKNTIISTISSIQMVNYQNLILNSQNKIEDLKIEIKKIYNEIIPNLERQKKNILNVKIKDLELKIDNIKSINIVDLRMQKENIQNDSIRKLMHKLNIDLPNQKVKFQEQIEQLKFNKSIQNIQNSKVVGKYIIKNHSAKPKKKLIVIVAFITSLIFSIFMVFFLNFIKTQEENYVP